VSAETADTEGEDGGEDAGFEEAGDGVLVKDGLVLSEKLTELKIT
jgi:hypothetical protein